MWKSFSLALMVVLCFFGSSVHNSVQAFSGKPSDASAYIGAIRVTSQGKSAVVGSGFAIKSDGGYKLFTAQHVALRRANERIEFCSQALDCIDVPKALAVGPVLSVVAEQDWVYWQSSKLPKGLRPLRVGPVPKTGDAVCALGNPLGRMGEVTCGAVTNHLPFLIYTDARVLPGNSGGPLVDSRGRVVGIMTGLDIYDGQFVPDSAFAVDMSTVWY